MNRALRLALATLLAMTGLGAGTSAASSGMAATSASLSATPGNGGFTAGQEVTITGSIGRAGKRAVRLQTNMGRPGDIWRDVVGGSARTNAAGAFTIRIPAPSMEGILYRAVSGSRTTPVWTSQVRHQDVRLWADDAVAGRPFTLTADTTTMPLLAGRQVTLQQRSGTAWTTLASTTLGADGRATFATTVGAPGTVVYRVRLEDWHQGVGHVGWFPSYPLYVDVAATGSRQPAAGTVTGTSTRPTAATPAPRAAAPFQTTAGRTYRWGTARFDFDWELGESLTDKATLGTRRRGWWLDGSDGTGRVAMRNGAMQLSSQPEGPSYDSRGSIWATLQRNTQAYGRWETRVMPMTFQTRSADYRIRAELVPADPAQERCGAQNITLFELDPSRDEVLIGARSLSGAEWRRTIGGVTAKAFHAYGVEVTKKKITWFIDGRPVGKVADADAVSDVPLTVRVSMVGAADTSMTTTRTLVDWVRAWGPGTGRRTKGGAALTPGTHTSTC